MDSKKVKDVRDWSIPSKSIDEHKKHLRKVFETLRNNQLYVKEEKYSYGLQEVSFLGHWIGGGRIWMDNKKVVVVHDWSIPSKVRELRSFLGLANYYRRFIKGFSAIIAAPLTDLFKKDQK
ncbi:uncharacterized mitochondrial protein AtMg00860-like [Aristolochia californica]|uniref:uncharacterized mitochondrial protein AtMg00860-like n=1 Tax=Aristolochia californica TaxID=171875 RepID=UPI0035DC7BD1